MSRHGPVLPGREERQALCVHETWDVAWPEVLDHQESETLEGRAAFGGRQEVSVLGFLLVFCNISVAPTTLPFLFPVNPSTDLPLQAPGSAAPRRNLSQLQPLPSLLSPIAPGS